MSPVSPVFHTEVTVNICHQFLSISYIFIQLNMGGPNKSLNRKKNKLTIYPNR